MGIMAVAELTRFTISRVMGFLNDAQPDDGSSLSSRLQDFSAASLLLSIGVPLLKHGHPELHYNLRCVGAALPVAVGYAQTKARVKKIPAGSSGLTEMLWRSRHRWAAKRLCSYMTDFHHTPKIGWLLDVWEETTILITGRGLIIGSIALPLVLKSERTAEAAPPAGQNPYKEGIVSKQMVGSMPRISEVEDTRTRNLSGPLEGESFGAVSRWNRGADDIYLEFSVVQSGWKSIQQRLSLVFRACYLLLVFGPLLIFGPVIYFMSTLVTAWAINVRKALWWLLRFCLERGGAAFIKWGQWSATREDLFPEDMCLYLGRLHDRAPEHSYNQTRKAVLENLGCPIEDIFVDFPKKPCASGSIAQVYRAKLKDQRECPARSPLKSGILQLLCEFSRTSK